MIETTYFILLLVLSYHMTGQLIPQHRLSAVSSISGGSSDATIASSNTAAIQTSFANVFARPLVPCLGRWATLLLSSADFDYWLWLPLLLYYVHVCASPTFESILRHGGALHVLESLDILGQPLALLLRYRRLFVLQIDRKTGKD